MIEVDEVDGRLVVAGSSPALLKVLLSEYSALLAEHAPGLDRVMRPARPRGEVESVFADLGLPLSDELAVWFGWTGGLFPGRSLGLVQEPLALDVAASLYAEAPKGNDPILEWNAEWFPITTIYTASGLVSNCYTSAVRSLDYEVGATTHGPDSPLEVDSLCVPVAMWVTAIKRGWWPAVQNGQWDPIRETLPHRWALSGLM